MVDFWNQLRRECQQLDPGTAIETPISERLFEIEGIYEDRIDIRFKDSGEERSLRREQFEKIADRLDGGPLLLENLPPGVEPYAAVLSLSPEHSSVDGELSWDPDRDMEKKSPHLVSPERARTRPERIHDDAVLLADLLERMGTDEPTNLDTGVLTDLYVLLSDTQRGADQLRRSISDSLLERVGAGQKLHGRFGTIRRTTRKRRHPKDDGTVFGALEKYGIPHEWVMGVDPDKLDVVLAVTELEESEVYDVEQQVYVQKVGVDEEEKYSRLQGLARRLDEVEGGERLQEDLADLERRIDEALSAD